MSKNLKLIESYFNALAQGDFETVGNLFSDDVVWHQPGNAVQSGTYLGKGEVFNHLGNFSKWSNGTFAIDALKYIAVNGDLVAATIHFKAEKNDRSSAMDGIDLFRIENEKIKEVWLFSEKIEEEDEFWNYASAN
ncbi:nuclear transport factor 2 family protein [Sphingobacterium endophyticum]|uniref:nuclear transport factor 2 family protein n=1 Tax=Sphingobacterium endophyticum TaxID=2546448 RepID=UPI0012E24610|nr:nuclear transport factor 2 family protein [Sphingobacterium endophyticum]